jgi:hypothetical protein
MLLGAPGCLWRGSRENWARGFEAWVLGAALGIVVARGAFGAGFEAAFGFLSVGPLSPGNRVGGFIIFWGDNFCRPRVELVAVVLVLD